MTKQVSSSNINSKGTNNLRHAQDARVEVEAHFGILNAKHLEPNARRYNTNCAKQTETHAASIQTRKKADAITVCCMK